MKSNTSTILSLALAALVLGAATYGDAVSKFKGVVVKQSSDASKISLKSTCVNEDTDSGAGTHVLDDVIPAGVKPLGVACRVDTILAGTSLTTWSLGDGTDADLYGTTLTLAAGTTVDHSDYTASPSTQAWSSSSGDLTLTAAAGQFDTGNITCCSFYYDFTAPAS